MREVYRKTVDRPLETYLFLNYLGDDNLMFSKGEQTLKVIYCARRGFRVVKVSLVNFCGL